MGWLTAPSTCCIITADADAKQRINGLRRGAARLRGAIQGAQGAIANARVHRPALRLHPPDHVWEARLSLTRRPRRPSRPLPLLDAQGARKDGRLEAHRRRTRPVSGVDREQPGAGTDRDRNAPRLFARPYLHNRQAGSMNPPRLRLPRWRRRLSPSPERCVSTSDRLPSIGRSGKKSEPITISQEAHLREHFLGSRDRLVADARSSAVIRMAPNTFPAASRSRSSGSNVDVSALQPEASKTPEESAIRLLALSSLGCCSPAS